MGELAAVIGIGRSAVTVNRSREPAYISTSGAEAALTETGISNPATGPSLLMQNSVDIVWPAFMSSQNVLPKLAPREESEKTQLQICRWQIAANESL